MAFSGVTVLITAGRDISVNDLSSGNVTASAAVGDIVFVLLAMDNVDTTDVTTIRSNVNNDSSDNVYEHVASFTNGQGAAAAGAHIAVYKSKLTSALTSGVSFLTCGSGGNNADLCFVAYKVSIGAGNDIQVAGTVQNLANDGADPGSMAISGLPSKEYLFLRAIAAESETTTGPTPTTDFTAIAGTISSSAGATAVNMRVAGEYRIFTGTGATSDPTLFAADCASIFLAFEEFTPAGADDLFAQSTM